MRPVSRLPTHTASRRARRAALPGTAGPGIRDRCHEGGGMFSSLSASQRFVLPPTVAWCAARPITRSAERPRVFDMSFALTAAALLAATGAAAAVQPFPPAFRMEMVDANGTKIYVRSGGKGPAVVMLHGFGDSGDMWAPIAAKLVQDHTVIVPDLRGMGLSAHPDTGYTKKNEALDVAAVLDHLKVEKADLVTHDIGNMVGYAFAAQYPDRVTRWVVIDAPLPGIGNWDSITRSPLLWHFNFRGPDVERLVAGRERIYLDRFWNELSANPKAIDEATRRHYAKLYARPGAMHAAFNQFAAFTQDAIVNKDLAAKGKPTMPILAIGAEK